MIGALSAREYTEQKPGHDKANTVQLRTQVKQLGAVIVRCFSLFSVQDFSLYRL